VNRLISLAVVGLVACGGAAKKNVAACEDFIASLDCGAFDFSSIYPDGFCEDTYGETTCDISEYFTCLTDGATCENDIWSAPTDCTVPTCE
jgi:hypothetical protein